MAALRPSLEAVLMVADQPLEAVTLATAVGYPVGEVTAALTGLAAEYDEQGRGFELRNVGGGWRYYTRDDFAAVVEGFVLDGQQARLTRAALETLAVVAYKQPVSRARVSAIRGVNVDGVMRTLLNRGLVEEAGHDHETGANLYRTTGYFLERIGVTSIDELPELAPYLPDMDDLEDELAEMVGAGTEPPHRRASRPSRPPAAHASPHSGDGTEPDGGTEPHEPGDSMSLETDDEGLIRLQKLLAQSGVASRRKCEELMLDGLVVVDGEVVTRLGTKVDPTHGGDPGRRQAAAADLGQGLPGAQQAPRRGVDDVGPRGAAHPLRPGRRPARAALPRRPARHRHLRADHADQRRRLRPADGAPVLRGRQDLRRRARRRGHQGHGRRACSRASSSRTAR